MRLRAGSISSCSVLPPQYHAEPRRCRQTATVEPKGQTATVKPTPVVSDHPHHLTPPFHLHQMPQ